MGPLPRGPRKEAVQGAGMVGLFHAQGAAESDTSAHLGVRSHVPGTRRDRAQAEEAGTRKAKPQIETPSVGKGPQTRHIAFGKGSHRRNRAGGDPNPIRVWAVFQRGSAHEPPPENEASGRDVIGMLDRRSVRA
jgi:hypothetical protein